MSNSIFLDFVLFPVMSIGNFSNLGGSVMSNFIDFLPVISKIQSPIYRRCPQFEYIGS